MRNRTSSQVFMFNSNSSRAQSAGLINKLTSGISTSESTSKSTTEILNDQFKPKTKKVIKKQNKALQRKSDKNAKELKRVKYELIKSKKDSQLSVEHEKYLRKLTRRNKNLLMKNDDIDYDTRSLEDEILSFGKKNHKKKRSFKTKIATRLTPGLAPVDYNESDED